VKGQVTLGSKASAREEADDTAAKASANERNGGKASANEPNGGKASTEEK
jgi:hypothetical protein